MSKSDVAKYEGKPTNWTSDRSGRESSAQKSGANRRTFVQSIGAGFAACTFLTVSHGTAFAAENSDGKPTTKKLIVFKDGYSLVLKELKARTDAKGKVLLNDVPDEAILGSFWATSQTGTVKGMTAGWKKEDESIKKSVPCASRLEVLHANRGKVAKVAMKKEAYEGVIKEVLVEATRTNLTLAQHRMFGVTYLEPDHPYAMRPRDGETLKKYSQDVLDASTVTTLVGNQVVLDTSNGDVLLNIDDIKTVSIEDMATDWERELMIANRTKRIEIQLEEKESDQTINLMYFRPGLRWIPTYRLQIPQETQDELIAKLEMQAELVNQAEDFDEVPFDIVVGVPNFRFRETVSPLVLENQLRSVVMQADQLLGQQIAMNNFSNSVIRQQGYQNQPQSVDNAQEPPTEISGDRSQDLFVYHLETVALKRGERAAERVMRAEVPFEHVHTLDLRLAGNARSIPQAESVVDSPLEITRNDVWHQLTLTNKSEVPWTTGAVMVMQGDQPIAQELLTYTSVGSDVRVPLTVAVDVSATSREVEVARANVAITILEMRFVKVTKKATFKVHNKKAEKIVFEIKADIPGKAITATKDGKIEVQGSTPQDWDGDTLTAKANNHSVVKWKTEIEPRAEFEVEVEYHSFLRY